MSTPPVLVAPREKERLYLYVAATNRVVSTVLVIERAEEGKVHGVQRHVYYLSEVLSLSKQRYPHYQKLAYGVFMSLRKVAHYFSEHPITVVSGAPLSDILNNSKATDRVAKWSIELGPLDLTYKHPTSIKAQVLPEDRKSVV